MSGHCDWCGVWHSGSCCHPGRALYAAAQEQIGELERRLAHDNKANLLLSAEREIKQLETKLVELEQLRADHSNTELELSKWILELCVALGIPHTRDRSTVVDAVEQLHAERNALREALEQIAGMTVPCSREECMWCGDPSQHQPSEEATIAFAAVAAAADPTLGEGKS